MTAPQAPLPCPDCSRPLASGTGFCTHCGLRVSGPEAWRLWQVDEQLARLGDERRSLLEVLRRPAVPGAGQPAGPPLMGPPMGQPPMGSPMGAHPVSLHPRRSLSGQQILLGVGALLVLSMALFLGAVVWMVVGVVGQALFLVTLIALSAVGAHQATRHRLPAAAETGAALAGGLSLIGVHAAWSLDLAGLGSVPWLPYAAAAAVVIAALLLVLDRIMPRVDRDGRPSRPITIYEPTATTLLALAPWLLVAHLDPPGVLVVLALGALTGVEAALWLASRRLGHTPASHVAPLWGLGLGATAYLATGLVQAHDVGEPTREFSALLMVLTAALLAVGAARARQWGFPGLLPVLPYACAALTFLAAAAFAWEAHWALLLGAAVVLVVVVVVLAFAPWPPGTTESLAHRLAQVVVVALGGQVLVLLALLHLSDQESFVGAAFDPGPSNLLVAGALALWAVVAAAVAVRLRDLLWLVLAHVLLGATVTMGMLGSGAAGWTVAWLGVSAALAALVALLVLTHTVARAPWRGWDLVPLVFAGVFAAMALASSLGLGHPRTGATFVAVGVGAYALSLLPQRLALAYPGAFVISLGTSMLLAHEGWNVVESWSWPLALVLATIGWRHWRHNPAVRSRVSMGPALAAAFVPSVIVAIGQGDALRLALSSAAAVAVLVLGLVRRLQAPVAVAAACLVVIAITQGGPYIAILPAWLTTGVAGMVLIAIGVSWEHATLAGRRTSAWFAHLR